MAMYGTCALYAGQLTLQAHTDKIKYLLLFQGKNGYTNASKSYVTPILSVLLDQWKSCLTDITYSVLSPNLSTYLGSQTWAGQRSRYSYQLQAGRSGDRIPVEARFSVPVQTGPGAHPSLLYNGYRVFPGGKERPGRDADPSPPSSAVGHGRVELYLCSPYGSYGLYRASVPVQGCTLPYLTDHCRFGFHQKSLSTESKNNQIRLTSFRNPLYPLPCTEFDSNASCNFQDTKRWNEKFNG